MKRTLLIAVALISLGACGQPNSPDGTPSTASTVKQTVKFKAALLRGNGDQIKVARTDFRVMPYSEASIKDEVRIKNGVDDKLVIPQLEPLPTDSKYSGKPELYQADLNKYQAYLDEGQAWENKAYAGLEDAIKKKISERPPIEFQTNLDGEAEIELTPGDWYFTGDFQTTTSGSAAWLEVRMKVTADTKKIELSNDNATKLFR